jgi:5-methylcytosine-specific restriction endonuclease McrA
VVQGTPCESCGRLNVRNSIYCSHACKLRAWRRRHKITEPLLPQQVVCPDCGQIRVRKSTGPMPKRCVECAKLKSRRDMRIRYNALRTPSIMQLICADCGKLFIRNSPNGPIPVSCPECYDEYRRIYHKCRNQLTHVIVARRQYDVEWARNNKEAVRVKRNAHMHRRRAQKYRSPVEWFSRTEIFVRDKWRCGICKKFVDRDLKYPHPQSPSLDHVIPLSRGGHHIRANAQLAHLQCNFNKHDRMPDACL